MLDKYTWYVIQSKDENGKMYAWAHRVKNCNNLIGYYWGDNVISVNACTTKKEAQELAAYWNKCSNLNWYDEDVLF